ncbi:hypothetical protein JCM8097_004021 [Rhodosporidiobolus ruineniae]
MTDPDTQAVSSERTSCQGHIYSSPPTSSSHNHLPLAMSSPEGRWSHRSSTSGSDTATALSPTVQPIAIAGPPTAFPPPPAFLPSFDSSASSLRSPASGQIVDGPLHELLPALAISASVSSSEGSSFAGGVSAPSPRYPPGPFGRRVVSGPSSYLSSPSRGSPLSRSVGDSSEEDEPPWLARRVPQNGLLASSPAQSAPSQPLFHPPYGHRVATSPPDFDPSRLTSSRRRRRSSVSLSSSFGAPAIPPFGSFVGSFETSLLSGRLSAPPSLPLPFVASIGVMGSPDAPPRLRCPSHLHVPFSAAFYCPPGEISASSPYVGTVDLDQHFLSLLDPSSATSTSKPPKFPGYQVPIRGQLQLVLKNSNKTAFKPFLIPYDLTGLDRGGKGGRTFLRQKSYAVDEHDHKGKLRFSVAVNFCSPALPSKTRAKDKAASQPEPKYYLYGSVRVVFAPRGLDASDKLRVVLEGPEELLGAAGGPAAERFSPYGGPGPEWELARKKAKAREKLREVPSKTTTPTLSHLHDPVSTTTRTRDNSVALIDTPSAPYPASSLALASPPIPVASIPPLPSASLAPPLSPFSASTAPLEPLTFDRVPSPALDRLPPFLAVERQRKLSAQSGLAASRPPSRTGEGARGGSVERCGR